MAGNYVVYGAAGSGHENSCAVLRACRLRIGRAAEGPSGAMVVSAIAIGCAARETRAKASYRIDDVSELDEVLAQLERIAERQGAVP